MNNLDPNLLFIFGTISVTIFVVLFAGSYLIVTARNFNKRLDDVQDHYRQHLANKYNYVKSKKSRKDQNLTEQILDFFDITIYFEQAGIYESTNTFVLTFFVTVSLVFALLFYFTMQFVVSIILAFSICFTCFYLFLKIKKKRRIQKFDEQLPITLDTISRSLKAGYPTIAGFQTVAAEMPEPVKTEFSIIVRENKLGIPLEESLIMLSERIPLLDLRMFVMSVVLHHTIGGNLSEVLDNLSKVIRERFKLLRQVEVITAEARLSGWIMCIAPVIIFLILLTINPPYAKLLLETDLGNKMIFTALAFQFFGLIVIQKMIKIKV